MPFQLHAFPSAVALAQAAASAWLQQLESLASTRRPHLVALSGGRIAARFFDALSSAANGRSELFNGVQFFWGDERCVPPTDPESNFLLAREHLLAPLKIPERQIHRVRGELAPEQAATEAEMDLRNAAPLGSGGQPVIDLVFLGVGEEGHTASLFPGEAEAVMTSPAVYRPVIGPKPPPNRITLGYPTIATARQVWVLASGDGKKDAFQKSLQPAATTPLGRILGLRTQTRVFSDIV